VILSVCVCFPCFVSRLLSFVFLLVVMCADLQPILFIYFEVSCIMYYHFVFCIVSLRTHRCLAPHLFFETVCFYFFYYSCIIFLSRNFGDIDN